MTPNFIDPATKLEGNMDTEESKAKHPGQPFLRKNSKPWMSELRLDFLWLPKEEISSAVQLNEIKVPITSIKSGIKAPFTLEKNPTNI